MKLVKCDNHPDRDAVTTLSIKILPVGVRPWIIGLESSGKMLDLCEECRDSISPKLELNEDSPRSLSGPE